MRLKTFRARTMADALAAVKRDLGKDAVILHTRSVKEGGLWGIGARRVVEIIASDDVNVAGPRVRPSAPRAAVAAARPSPAEEAATAAPVAAAVPRAAAVDAYRRSATVAAPARAPEPAGVAAVAEPSVKPDVVVMPVRKRLTAAGSAPAGAPSGAESGRPIDRLRTPVTLSPQNESARAGLEAELAAIKLMVGQVLQQSAPTRCGGLMPEALFKQYLKLLEGQVAREIADRIIGAVRDELNPGELTDETIVRQTVLRHLAAMIPVAQSVAAPPAGRAADGRPLTIALVGPTGVGKTTTIAKLAAAYKLRHGRKVGLITSDTYRIAAVEQLRTYANIIAVPLKVVMTPSEMAAACAEMAQAGGPDVVLIDTAGRSQHDSARLEELRAFVTAADPHETHLVLSSAASEAVLMRAAEQFAVVSPNRVILTKLDEAVNFGVVVNVAERLGCVGPGGGAKLSFVTTGQEVPDHIEPGHADRLARLVLDGELTR